MVRQGWLGEDVASAIKRAVGDPLAHKSRYPFGSTYMCEVLGCFTFGSHVVRPSEMSKVKFVQPAMLRVAEFGAQCTLKGVQLWLVFRCHSQVGHHCFWRWAH